MVTKEQLEEMYVDKGLNIFTISRRTGINRSSLRELIAEYGLTRSGNPRKSRIIMNANGYMTINGKLHHRYIWEKENGPIPQGWIIHHLNGIKSDNRLENLLAISRDKHSTRYVADATRERISELEKENNNLKALISVYDDYICEMLT